MERFLALILFSLAIFLSSPSAIRAERTFQSGPSKTSLIELYTSEGCSSCPPAEEWLSDLRNDAGLWSKFVPIAFHVVYWDKLGWRDAFASKKFTERQYAYASAWTSGSVYTPCLVNDGREWQRRGSSVELDKKAPPPGPLRLTSQNDTLWNAEFVPSPQTSSGPFDLCIAQLGGDISVAVRAGENAGKKLRHDFVAFEWVTVPLEEQADQRFLAKATLTQSPPAGVGRRAIAAWVVKRGELAPLQAVGGWLDASH